MYDFAKIAREIVDKLRERRLIERLDVDTCEFVIESHLIKKLSPPVRETRESGIEL